MAATPAHGNEQDLTTPDSSTPPPSAAPPAERRVLVGTLIGLASLLFLITAAVLYFRWASMNEPDCVIVVETPVSFKGGEVTVDSIVLTKPLKGVIGENDRYAIPFYVDPGEYDVKVTINGETQYESRVALRPRYVTRVDLTKMKPTTTAAVSDPTK
jgi:hypothetical protein